MVLPPLINKNTKQTQYEDTACKPYVSDLSQSLEFYQSVLGFKTVGIQLSGKALLSVGSNDSSSYLVELLPVNTGANKTVLMGWTVLLEEQDYTTLPSCFLKESFWRICSKIKMTSATKFILIVLLTIWFRNQNLHKGSRLQWHRDLQGQAQVSMEMEGHSSRNGNTAIEHY